MNERRRPPRPTPKPKPRNKTDGQEAAENVGDPDIEGVTLVRHDKVAAIILRATRPLTSETVKRVGEQIRAIYGKDIPVVLLEGDVDLEMIDEAEMRERGWVRAQPKNLVRAKPEVAPVDFTPVSWEEYGERIRTSLAKSAKKEREMREAIDAVMAAGLFAATGKGAVTIALAKVFAAMIPNGEPMPLIPEGWAPVVLAIDPVTGEFLTIVGPRSEPDGRVEPVETMLARQMQNSVASTLCAVREAGRPKPKPRDEARPRPKTGGSDCVEAVVVGPINDQTCEACRAAVGMRFDASGDDECIRDIIRRCECEHGCGLIVADPDRLETDDESEEK